MFSQSQYTKEHFEQIIIQKDKEIQRLQEKLKLAELKIQKLQQNTSKKFVKIDNFQYSGPEEIQVTAKDLSFHIKEPLDTAHIADMSTPLGSLKNSFPKVSEFALSFQKPFNDTRAFSLPKSRLFEISEKTTPSTTMNHYSQLDEMIFSNAFDKNT